MRIIPHQTISASAGAGKTYQLTNRYIKLLALSVPPERIVALTFTRKAAGEIFDRIIKRLADAVLSDKERDDLNNAIGETLNHEQLITLLQQLIQAIPLLRIGTLDSFMTQVLRLFSFELGIQGGFEIIDGPSRQLEEQKALRRVLAHTLTNEEKKEFLQSFKLATYGSEEKSVTRTMTTFIEDYHGVYLDAPVKDLWGNPSQIWPAGCYWFNNIPTEEQFRSALEELQDYIPPASATNSYIKAWKTLIEKCEAFDSQSLFKSTLSERLLENIDELRNGSAQIEFGKKNYDIDKTIGSHVYTLFTYMIAAILIGRTQRTRGIFKVLEQYELTYNKTVRKAGKISFRDIVHILNFGTDVDAKAPRMTQSKSTSFQKMLYINYRMDGRYDHWMIDEFQDTSNAQWQVLSSLIDEIMQDVSDERSFFYVGDVKQAIYGWRGGDSRLFDRVYNRYKSEITKTPLSKSWRSAPAIIDTVNHVFSNLPADELPAEVITRWKASWDTHETARGDLPGYSALYELPKLKEIPDAENRYELTAAIVKEQLARNPHLAIAILVRSGKAGQQVTNLLRKHNIQAIWEGDAAIIDNTVCAALLSLIKLAQHPGDTFAIEHVRMTPLLHALDELKLTFATLPVALQQDLHNEGFEFTLRKWINVCKNLPGRTFSDFTIQRLNLLLQCALEFDLQHTCNVVQFIDYVTQTKIGGTATGQVRVLTIHKAKGLEFDAVILPDLQAKGLTALRAVNLTTHLNQAVANPEPDWVYLYPGKNVVDTDPVLAAHRDDLQADKTYEELCALYVAITRAKHALYMITTQPGKTSKTCYASVLLKQQLSTSSQSCEISDIKCELLFETGTRDWAQKIKDDQPEKTVIIETLPNLTAARPRTRLERHIPSDEEKPDQQAELLFMRSGRQAADFGTAIHALFEGIIWLDETDITQVITTWQESSTLPQEAKERVVEEFKKALDGIHVQVTLNKPEGAVEVWREKRFEIALDKRWISGCFDRVTIIKDKKGTPVSAQILDYKSNRIKNKDDLQQAVEHYRPQLKLYREVLEKMLHLPEQSISMVLLFTHTGDVIAI